MIVKKNRSHKNRFTRMNHTIYFVVNTFLIEINSNFLAFSRFIVHRNTHEFTDRSDTRPTLNSEIRIAAAKYQLQN